MIINPQIHYWPIQVCDFFFNSKYGWQLGQLKAASRSSSTAQVEKEPQNTLHVGSCVLVEVNKKHMRWTKANTLQLRHSPLIYQATPIHTYCGTQWSSPLPLSTVRYSAGHRQLSLLPPPPPQIRQMIVTIPSRPPTISTMVTYQSNSCFHPHPMQQRRREIHNIVPTHPPTPQIPLKCSTPHTFHRNKQNMDRQTQALSEVVRENPPIPQSSRRSTYYPFPFEFHRYRTFFFFNFVFETCVFFLCWKKRNCLLTPGLLRV